MSRTGTSVEMRDVGKRFVKYEDAPMLITAALRFRQRTRRSALWAVRHVDLDLARGECMGIIGRNGSGKSTLLSMLAGVTAPSEGRMVVHGRVAPLISVGVGFHPELTGRENVYVNGIILGMSRREIDASFDEIVDFAELPEFIDTPVKFYSSGMFVRLGFAVAVQARPDILLVDEVLAVGDLAFQLKCFDRMLQIRDAGATIVVVSHNLNAVRMMCERTAVLSSGSMRYLGDTTEAISIYHDLLGEDRDLEGGSVEPGVTPAVSGTTSGAARIGAVELIGESGEPTRHLRAGERARVRATIWFDQVVTQPIVGAAVTTDSGTQAYTDSDRDALRGPMAPGSEVTVNMSFTAALVTGTYSVAIGLSDGESTPVAASPSVPFFVSARPTADGVADLDARFTVG